MKKILKKLSTKYLFEDGEIPLQEAYQLFKNVPVEIAIFDQHGKYRYANQMYCTDDDIRHDILGMDDNYFFQRTGISEDCAEERKRHFSTSVDEKKVVRFTEKLFIPEKNKYLYYKRSYHPIYTSGKNSEVTGVCLFGHDLTAVVLGQKELKYLAYHDKLTGLRNREAFYEQLDQLILDMPRSTEKKLTAILFCDLDSFKLVNDSLGHDIGDLVLKEVAARIGSSLRASDFVFRLGGDEFTVINRHLNSQIDATKIATKIIEKLSKPFFIKGHKITYLTTSIGIVLLPQVDADRETIVKNADTAMYHAKKKGKNQFQFFSYEMTEDSINRLKIENNLQALVNDRAYDNECKILYQPIIARANNGDFKMIGSEALLRWTNPELGFVEPDKFIPIAEETNLISAIGDWIILKTCSDIQPLINQFDFKFYISINLSTKQLKSGHILKILEEVIKKTGIKPTNIQLELTETSYLEERAEVLTYIEKLINMGIRLAIDDFGVGFASLVYLQQIPASTIKIDKSFIKNMSESVKDQQLVKSIINMGQNLNKDVVAEGVERSEDLEFLSANNCNTYQGFLFSRPLPIKNIEGLLADKLTFHY